MAASQQPEAPCRRPDGQRPMIGLEGGVAQRRGLAHEYAAATAMSLDGQPMAFRVTSDHEFEGLLKAFDFHLCVSHAALIGRP
ncbi:hypothetical protein [Bosea thiooxidans]